jgi:hypothetical protein
MTGLELRQILRVGELPFVHGARGKQPSLCVAETAGKEGPPPRVFS